MRAFSLLPTVALAVLSGLIPTVLAQDNSGNTDTGNTDTGNTDTGGGDTGGDTGGGADPSASADPSAADPSASTDPSASGAQPSAAPTSGANPGTPDGPGLSVSEPSGNSVANVGTTLVTQWGADQTGTWTNLKVELMSGSNYAMIALQTVCENIDATTQTQCSFQVPNVSPYSKIYFLQYSAEGGATSWSTRFTISGVDGSTVPPPGTEPDANGNPVGYGNGTLGDGATATATSNTLPLQSGVNGTGITLYTQGLPTATGLPAGVSGGVAAATVNAKPPGGNAGVSIDLRPAVAVLGAVAGAALLL